MDTLLHILSLLAMFYLGMFWQARKTRKKLPYAWTCTQPGCKFRAASDNSELVLRIADNHANTH